MSGLGALLELLHAADERVSGFEAEYREWSRLPPSSEVTVKVDADGRTRELGWRGAGPFPRAVSLHRRIWFKGPASARVEMWRNNTLVRFGVRDGIRWWRWDREDGASTGEAGTHPRAAMTLPALLSLPQLSPAGLLGTLCLEAAGKGSRAGRAVLCAYGRPRHTPVSNAVFSHEFEFESEYGSVLRHALFQDGQCVWVTEALDVRYGGDIDVERFKFIAPDGQETGRVPGLRGLQDVPPTLPPRDVHVASAHGLATHPPQGGGTLWLTGVPAAGKTTLALATAHLLAQHGRVACVLDGDALRRGLSSDLGLSPVDRGEQARRAAHVAALIASADVVAIVALVSPYTQDRQRAREIHDELGLPFFEVWVDTPLRICQRRDPKGLYARARIGELHGLTGVDAPYEPPEAPELRVAGHEDPEEVAARIVEVLALGPDRAIAAASNR